MILLLSICLYCLIFSKTVLFIQWEKVLVLITATSDQSEIYAISSRKKIFKKFSVALCQCLVIRKLSYINNSNVSLKKKETSLFPLFKVLHHIASNSIRLHTIALLHHCLSAVVFFHLLFIFHAHLPTYPSLSH